MAAALPTESAIDKAMDNYGIGTYDSLSDSSNPSGEDSECREPRGKSLPDAGPPDVFGPDRLLSYPSDPDARLGSWCRNVFAAAELPGDADRPVTHTHPNMSFFDSRVMSVAQEPDADCACAELPSDAGNPSPRSDYYDRTVTGGTGDIWPKEDSGAYVSQDKEAASALPGVMKNEEIMDNGLQSLGNWQSGYEIEDVSGPYGFPATDFSENVDFGRSDLQSGGRVLASRSYDMKRTATNIQLVSDLTLEFLREFGKEGLTKRHVLAFLQSRGEPQFLSSDIIRCLKLNHDVHVKDVLDEFPIAKKASYGQLASVRDRLIQLEIDNITVPEVSSVYRRCAADLSRVIADLERIEGRNG